MYNWDEIQRRIFATESGGDYNALYNYQNRPDGRFSDVQLTEMPISDVLSFTNPQGEYASYVRGQVGRTATPVGAYQVVGSTLRNAVEALGIDPSTPFNQETQDRIGRWILENQGPQAWEGLTRGGNMNGLLGGGPVTASSMNPQQPEQNRFFNADTRDRLIMALQGMTLNPNQALIQTAAQGIQQRAAQRQTTEERNATAEWLQQNGMGQYADAVRRGLMTGAEAFNIARTESETATQTATAAGQRTAAAEWLRTTGGPQGSRFADLVESGVMTIDQALEQMQGPEGTSAMQNYQFLLSTGVDPEEAMRRAFSGGTTINLGPDGQPIPQPILDVAAESFAQGNAATRNLQDINRLQGLFEQIPEGGEAALISALNDMGINVEGSDAVAAANALISRLVPQQRPPGSGTISDADLALYKSSLPRLVNTREGNMLILEGMRAIAEYDRQHAAISMQLMTNQISAQEAYEAWNNLEQPLANIIPRINAATGGASAEGGDGGASGSGGASGANVTSSGIGWGF